MQCSSPLRVLKIDLYVSAEKRLGDYVVPEFSCEMQWRLATGTLRIAICAPAKQELNK